MNKNLLRIIILALSLCIGIGTVLFTSNYRQTNKLIITEVRSDYGNILYDSTGAYHGFVEIYNSSDEDICLDGYYISDSSNNTYKYQISNCTLKSGEYTVFWTNSYDDILYIDSCSSYDYKYFLGFGLDSNETVLLSDTDGNVIDKVPVPAFNKGYSYSREKNTSQWATCEATPGFENNMYTTYNFQTPSAPNISLPSGFYTNDIQIEISAPKNCTIYYTLDGSVPNLNSLVYTAPIHLTDASNNPNIYSSYSNISLIDTYTPEYPVPKANILRAICVDNNGNISDVTNATYFIDFDSKYGFEDISVMSIIVNPDDLFSDDLGIYVLGDVFKNHNSTLDFSDINTYYTALGNYSMEGKGWKRPAYIEYFSASHDLHTRQNISLSIHGGYSVALSQKAFNIYALPEADNNNILLKDIFEYNQNSYMLRAGGTKDTYSTRFRDVLNHSLVSDRNIAVQDSLPCQVFINGEYWGLYNLQERISANYISTHYNVDEKNIIILKNTDVVSGEADSYSLYNEIVSFARDNNLSVDENYQYVSDRIDIQSYIDYYCFQIYVANTDIITNNYALWRSKDITNEPYCDGKWRWILYDTDDSTGLIDSLGIVGNRTSPEIDSFNEGSWSYSPLEDDLFSALICNEEFKLQFAQTFVEMAENNFSYNKVDKIIDQFYDKYCEAAVISNHRFISETYTENDYAKQIHDLKDFYERRYNYIYDYMVYNLGLK